MFLAPPVFRRVPLTFAARRGLVSERSERIPLILGERAKRANHATAMSEAERFERMPRR